MPGITAIFDAKDNLTNIFDSIAQAGRKMQSTFEDVESTIADSLNTKPVESFSASVEDNISGAASTASKAFGTIESQGTGAFEDVQGSAEDAFSTTSKVAQEASSDVQNAVTDATGMAQRSFGDMGASGSDAFAQVEKAAQNLESTSTKALEGINNKFGKLALAGKTLVGAFAVDKISELTIGANAQLEQSKIAYESISGSAETAQKNIDTVLKLAAKTPFEKKELIQAGKVVAGIGGDFEKNLKGIGNLAAAMGVQADNAADAVRDTLGASLEAVEGRLGIPKKAILEWMKQNNKLEGAFNEKGVVQDYDKAREALMDFANSRFGNAMEKQSTTMLGMMSTIKDTAIDFGRVVGEKAFGKVKDRVSGLLTTLDSLSESGQLQSWAEGVGTVFAGIFDVTGLLTDFLMQALSGVPMIFDKFLKPAFDIVLWFFKGIGFLFQGFDAYDAFQGVVDSVNDLLYGLFDKDTADVLSDNFIEAWSKVTDTIDVLIKETIPAIIDKATEIFANFMTAVKPFADSIMTVVGAIADIFFTILLPIVADVVTNVVGYFLKVGEFWMNVVNNNILPFVTAVVSAFQTYIMPVIRDVINIVVNDILPIFFDALNFITTTILPILQQTFNTVFPYIQSIVENAFILINAAWENILKPAIDAVIGAFQFAWPFIKGLVEAAVTGIGDLIGGLTRTFSGIIEFVTGVFTGNWSKAWQGVKDIFGGIFDSLAALVKTPMNAVIGIINGAIDHINGIGFDVPDWVPLIGGKSFKVDIPKIPMLAKGTDSWQGGNAIVGEAGAELVLGPQFGDLPKGSTVLSNDKTMGLLSGIIQSLDQEQKQNELINALDKIKSTESNNVNVNLPSSDNNIKLPSLDSPIINVAASEIPDLQVPEIASPEISIPKADSPIVNIPDIKLPSINIPDINTPSVTVPDIVAPTTEVNIPTLGEEKAKQIMQSSVNNTKNNTSNDNRSYTITLPGGSVEKADSKQGFVEKVKEALEKILDDDYETGGELSIEF